MLIHIRVENGEPIAGEAGISGKDMATFSGWLDLLRLLEKLVVSSSELGSADEPTA